jgi:hypothetical protein
MSGIKMIAVAIVFAASAGCNERSVDHDAVSYRGCVKMASIVSPRTDFKMPELAQCREIKSSGVERCVVSTGATYNVLRGFDTWRRLPPAVAEEVASACVMMVKGEEQ